MAHFVYHPVIIPIYLSDTLVNGVTTGKIIPHAVGTPIDRRDSVRNGGAVQVAPCRIGTEPFLGAEVVRLALFGVELTEQVATLEGDGNLGLVLHKGSQVVVSKWVATDSAELVGHFGRAAG